ARFRRAAERHQTSRTLRSAAPASPRRLSWIARKFWRLERRHPGRDTGAAALARHAQRGRIGAGLARHAELAQEQPARAQDTLLIGKTSSSTWFPRARPEEKRSSPAQPAWSDATCSDIFSRLASGTSSRFRDVRRTS